jgi:2-amino-4-hydroxy-6-hydroxymethyldihydropteridine diphosphokinase
MNIMPVLNCAVMKSEAAISFGSNIGDRHSNLCEALKRLQQLEGVKLLCKSLIYETEPVDVPAEFQGIPFFNAVAIFSVETDVEEWSTAVHAVEDEMLRVRGEQRNAPRTIDLDLLYFGNLIVNKPHLRIPHPQIASRRFVCEPLSLLRPQLILPNTGKTILQMLELIPQTPSVRLLDLQW